MGMAASQARFLGLTARKTNTEYEGQQVNQQRTALANESSGLFNKMLKLSVPLPPDPNNFYNTRYSFDHAGKNYEIIGYSSATTGKGGYDVKTKYSEYVEKLYEKAQENVMIQRDANNDLQIQIGSWSGALTGPAQNASLTIDAGLPTGQQYYMYNYTPNPDSAGTNYYITKEMIEKFMQDHPADKGKLDKEYFYSTVSETKYKTFQDVDIIKDESGKFAAINVEGNIESLELQRVRDDAGYENAMYLYTTEKESYDRTISDINTQTEIIQQQDRTLELRLKQLDTEQNALQTEMEAVSKVIEKNIESTFKTFA